jgi:hypothetical protein
VFERYASGLGINRVLERLHAEGVMLGNGAVRRMLGNERYLGKAIWGQRRFERNPGTRQKVARTLPRSEWKIIDRPDLRIVDDETWERVLARRREVKGSVPTSGRMRSRDAASSASICSPGSYGAASAAARSRS